MHNLLKRQAEVEILPMAQALRLAAIAYGPSPVAC
jgi:aryl-alcohol dehydrogenase-like predicted oxidoreductase